MATKTFPLAEFKIDGEGTGRYAGYVAVFGNVDRGGDLIEQGAFKGSLDAFVRDGFLAWGHDYHALPIGMVDEAREDAVGLYMAGPFHSTAFAQEARTTAAERLAAGKPMGMSIGYEAKAWEFRKIPGERGPYGEEVRVLTGIDVFEGSLVPLPMNPRAALTGVKDASAPFADHADRVLVDVRAFVDRAGDLTSLRAKEGRVLSASNRQRLTALLEALAAAGTDIEELLSATEPAQPKGVDLRSLYGEFLRTEARLNGVAVGGG